MTIAQPEVVNGLTTTDGTAELVLYVSKDSPACIKALATLQAVLEELPPNHLRLDVRDVATHVDAATADRILFTPTLLYGTREPYVRVLGDLTNRAVLLDLLESIKLNRP
jgi:hypothetical protein